ncbi:16299_t:CDS:2, partial [Funneliformis mosseae]
YEEVIITDSSMSSDQLSNINGCFTPYFDNVTSTLFFYWIQKHNISTNTYNDLVDILQHSEFNVKEVVKNE